MTELETRGTIHGHRFHLTLQGGDRELMARIESELAQLKAEVEHE